MESKFGDAVQAVARPGAPLLPDVLRVADLYCGDGTLGRAARSAGLEVVCAEEPDAQARRDANGVRVEPVRRRLDFDRIPAFNILLASVSPAGAFDHALRFIRVRRPQAFVLMGRGDDAFLRAVREKTRRLGYEVRARDVVVGGGGGAEFRYEFPPEDGIGAASRNLAGKPTFSRSSILGRRISIVWRFPCRIPSETMPYRTGIRLSRVARNLAKGFPARLLGRVLNSV